MRESNGWIFSPKLDLAAFTGPILLSLLFTACFKLQLSFTQYVFYFMAFNIFFNVAHVYSTFWYTYTSPDDWKRFGRWFIVIPLVFIIVNYALGSLLNGLYIFIFFSHFSVWHFVKQQQAWFFISSGRGIIRDKLTEWLDRLSIHAATWGFVLSSQSGEESRGWFRPGDLVELPAVFHDILLWATWGILFAYCCQHLRLWLRTRQTNWAAHHVLVCAIVIWGYIRLAPQNALTFHFVQLHHAVPYLILSSRYIRVTKDEGRKYWLPALSPTMLIIGLYVIGLMVGKLESGMRNGVGFWWDSPDIFDGELSILAASLWNALSLTHYTLDGIIWNRKHNPNWTKALGQ